jgi:hypothetical protein
LWNKRAHECTRVFYLRECGPPGVWKKNLATDFWAGDPQLLSTAALPLTVEGGFGQAPARTTADC